MSRNNNNKKKEQISGQVDKVAPGELLRRARREKGMATEEVILNLGVTQRVLNALEKDEYDHLPAPLYVKGYIRRYCLILSIPENEVLVGYEALLRDKDIFQEEPRPMLMGAPKNKFSLWKLIVPFVLALLAALIIWMAQHSGGLKLDFFSDSSSMLTELPQNKNLNLTPPLPVDSEDNVVPRYHDDDNVDTSVTSELVVPRLQELQINVIQQSWVEVLDSRGGVLVAGLKPSGSKVEVTGMPPFDVVLGYAPGIELSYAGKQVIVETITTDNTATLKVGG
ncbi:MAG: cytoskeleton protein RodZ [Porticoccus sp.]|jgi:cytoskeleton protein RodZ